MPPVHLLVDQHIPFIDRLFDDRFLITRFDPDTEPKPEHLETAEILVIRTVTKVDQPMLDRAPNLKLLCSATAGYDHIPFDLLKKYRIGAYWSAGCNARSVAEYVTGAVTVWAEEKQARLEDLSVGIVGAGHAGSATAGLLEKTGCTCLCHDPPREQRQTGWQGVSVQQILNCDIISIHTGLDQFPDHPTRDWLDEAKLNSTKARLIINAARGGIIDEAALLSYQRNHSADFILDTWEHEPQFSAESARQSWLATPHIAGYSRQSKYRGSAMAAKAICRFFGIEQQIDDFLPPNHQVPEFPDAQSAGELIRQNHPAFEMHQKMQEIALEKDSKRRSSLFLKLRVAYPSPDEWASLSIPKEMIGQYPELSGLIS